MSTGPARVVPATELHPDRLDRLLAECFSPAKAAALREHGAWRHRGNENRFVLLDGADPVAYFASIPGEVCIDGAPRPVRWWMDLYVPPRFRGRGYQRFTDAHARGLPGLHLGFPNPLAATIHQRHGWGVRADLRVRMLPLVPGALPQVRRLGGARRLLARAGLLLLAPLAALNRQRLMRSGGERSPVLEAPDADLLAGVAARAAAAAGEQLITSHRSRSHLRWRFFESPHRDEHRFFVAGPPAAPTLAAVSRTFIKNGVRVTRLLDIFGSFDDRSALRALLRRVVREAALAGSVAVTALASHDQLDQALLRAGFVLRAGSLLRWWCSDEPTMARLAGAPCHWVLSDSDNDSVE